MKNLKLSIKIIRDYVFSNVLLVLQIVLSLFIIMLMVNRYNFIFSSYNDFNSDQFRKSILVSTNLISVEGEDEYYIGHALDSRILEQIEMYSSHPYVRSISRIQRHQTVEAEGYGIDVIVYDEITATFAMNKTKGSSLFENNDSDIVVYNMPGVGIGDALNIEIVRFNNTTADLARPETLEPGYDPATDISEFNFKVGGVVEDISKGYVELTFSSFGSIDLDRFRSQVGVDQPMIFVPYSEELFGDYIYTNPSVLVYLDENIPDSEVDKLLVSLGEFGYAQTGEDILRNSRQAAEKTFDKDIVMVFTMVGITFVCIFSMTFLNMKRYLKKAYIYLLAGATKRNVYAIYSIYMLMMIAISGVLYGSIANIVTWLTSGSATSYDIRFTIYRPDLLTVCGALLFITFFMGMISFLTFKFMTNASVTENKNRRN
jgi:hypothetical protein